MMRAQRKFIVIIVPFVLLTLPLFAYAAELRVGNEPTVNTGEAIADDVYLAGSTVSSAGNLAGDLIAAGGNVIVKGVVGADAVLFGGTITLLADVGDDMRAAGGTLTLEGTFGGDAVLAGGQVSLSGEGIGGDVLGGAGIFRLEAPVRGDVRIGAGDVYINAPVEGNVHIYADNVRLGSNAAISGNFSYTALREAQMDKGARVLGEMTFTPSSRAMPKEISVATILALASAWILGQFFAAFACALVIGLLFERYSVELVNITMNNPLLEVGRGLLALILLPLASIVFLMSVIGIPLGLLGLAAFVGIVLLSIIAAPIILGSVVYAWFQGSTVYEVSWKTILLGSVIYLLLGVIPVLGGIAKFLIMLATLGAAVKFKWDIAKGWR